MKGNKPTDRYCTPQELVDLLPEFDLDPCSNTNSVVRAKRTVMLPENGLEATWEGLVWCNPPYSYVPPWVDAAGEAANGKAAATVFMLIKNDPTTRWWAKAVLEYGATSFPLRKRVKFIGGDGKSKFTSALLVFNGQRHTREVTSTIQTLLREGWIW